MQNLTSKNLIHNYFERGGLVEFEYLASFDRFIECFLDYYDKKIDSLYFKDGIKQKIINNH